VEVDVRLTLARAYEELGLFKEQEEMSREAVRVGKAQWGELHERIAEALILHGYALFGLRRYDESVAAYEEALRIRKALYGERHPSVAQSYNRVAIALLFKGDRSKSEAFLRKELAIYESLPNAKVATAYAYATLGRLMQDSGKMELAETNYRAAIRLHKEASGDENRGVAEAMFNLASVLHLRRDYGAAEELLQKTLAIHIKTMGAGHHQVAHTLLFLGSLRLEQKDFEGAERNFREALAIEQKGFGEEHQFVAEVLAHLARLHVRKGDWPKAEEIHRKALAMEEKVLGRNHPNTVRSRAELAEVLKRTQAPGSSR
jgi:tetratricopeptide (TPR) repeat protein